MKMGFVAYGAAEGPEGPIVDKRFFQDPQSLTRDLTTKHTEMGIGRASGTCEIGLSTLCAHFHRAHTHKRNISDETTQIGVLWNHSSLSRAATDVKPA